MKPRGSTPEIEDFAAYLRGLKERGGRSYGALARRLNVSASTLHRHCSGEAVPADFALLERFARLCEATPDERLELHRMWLAATEAGRRREREPATPEPDEPEAKQPEAKQPEANAPEPTPEPKESEPKESEPKESEPAAERPSPPRRRSRRLAVAVAAGVVAVVGVVSAGLMVPDSAGEPASGPAPDPVELVDPGPGPGPDRHPAPDTHPAPDPEADTQPDPAPAPDQNPDAGQEPDDAGPPLDWTVDSDVWQSGCSHRYVVDRPAEEVPAPPVQQDAREWAESLGTVDGGQTGVRITVQGRDSAAVVLQALRVRVVERAAPVPGGVFHMSQGCGGSLVPRGFDVDLDADRPLARSRPGGDENGDIPAVALPYAVSVSEPEVLLVTAGTVACDCRWYLELEWSSQGRSGTVRVDDGGRPFRTSGVEGRSEYYYDHSEDRWVGDR